MTALTSQHVRSSSEHGESVYQAAASLRRHVLASVQPVEMVGRAITTILSIIAKGYLGAGPVKEEWRLCGCLGYKWLK
jgi:hypothetical protein